MIKRVMSIMMLLVSLVLTGVAFVAPEPAQAVGICDNTKASADAKAAAGCNDGTKSESQITQAILRVMYWVIIVLAVIMIIVGGLMYVTSAGDPGKTSKAKATIMVAVVGLVIGILASAIINFVIDSLVK